MPVTTNTAPGPIAASQSAPGATDSYSAPTQDYLLTGSIKYVRDDRVKFKTFGKNIDESDKQFYPFSRPTDLSAEKSAQSGTTTSNVQGHQDSPVNLIDECTTSGGSSNTISGCSSDAIFGQNLNSTSAVCSNTVSGTIGRDIARASDSPDSRQRESPPRMKRRKKKTLNCGASYDNYCSTEGCYFDGTQNSPPFVLNAELVTKHSAKRAGQTENIADESLYCDFTRMKRSANVERTLVQNKISLPERTSCFSDCSSANGDAAYECRKPIGVSVSSCGSSPDIISEDTDEKESGYVTLEDLQALKAYSTGDDEEAEEEEEEEERRGTGNDDDDDDGLFSDDPHSPIEDARWDRELRTGSHYEHGMQGIDDVMTRGTSFSGVMASRSDGIVSRESRVKTQRSCMESCFGSQNKQNTKRNNGITSSNIGVTSSNNCVMSLNKNVTSPNNHIMSPNNGGMLENVSLDVVSSAVSGGHCASSTRDASMLRFTFTVKLDNNSLKSKLVDADNTEVTRSQKITCGVLNESSEHKIRQGQMHNQILQPAIAVVGMAVETGTNEQSVTTAPATVTELCTCDDFDDVDGCHSASTGKEIIFKDTRQMIPQNQNDVCTTGSVDVVSRDVNTDAADEDENDMTSGFKSSDDYVRHSFLSSKHFHPSLDVDCTCESSALQDEKHGDDDDDVSWNHVTCSDVSECSFDVTDMPSDGCNSEAQVLQPMTCESDHLRGGVEEEHDSEQGRAMDSDQLSPSWSCTAPPVNKIRKQTPSLLRPFEFDNGTYLKPVPQSSQTKHEHIWANVIQLQPKLQPQPKLQQPQTESHRDVHQPPYLKVQHQLSEKQQVNTQTPKMAIRPPAQVLQRAITVIGSSSADNDDSRIAQQNYHTCNSSSGRETREGGEGCDGGGVGGASHPAVVRSSSFSFPTSEEDAGRSSQPQKIFTDSNSNSKFGPARVQHAVQNRLRTSAAAASSATAAGTAAGTAGDSTTGSGTAGTTAAIGSTSDLDARSRISQGSRPCEAATTTTKPPRKSFKDLFKVSNIFGSKSTSGKSSSGSLSSSSSREGEKGMRRREGQDGMRHNREEEDGERRERRAERAPRSAASRSVPPPSSRSHVTTTRNEHQRNGRLAASGRVPHSYHHSGGCGCGSKHPQDSHHQGSFSSTSTTCDKSQLSPGTEFIVTQQKAVVGGACNVSQRSHGKATPPGCAGGLKLKVLVCNEDPAQDKVLALCEGHATRVTSPTCGRGELARGGGTCTPVSHFQCPSGGGSRGPTSPQSSSSSSQCSSSSPITLIQQRPISCGSSSSSSRSTASPLSPAARTLHENLLFNSSGSSCGSSSGGGPNCSGCSSSCSGNTGSSGGSTGIGVTGACSGVGGIGGGGGGGSGAVGRGHTSDFVESLDKLQNCGWYWGALGLDDAEARLSQKPDGTFLVRDSSDDRYILSLSFRSLGATHHTRIEHYKGSFSFYCQPHPTLTELAGVTTGGVISGGVGGGSETLTGSHATIVDFIEKSMDACQGGRCLYYLRPRGPGMNPAPVQLLHPLSRFRCMHSLKHLCKFAVLRHVRVDLIDRLPISPRLKEYIRESHL